MAKSLRSKWKRKMRAEKRIRYGEKELVKLKKMLTDAGDYQMVGEQEPMPEDKIPINAVPRPKSQSSIARRERSVSRGRKSRRDEFNGDSEDEEDDEEETPSGDVEMSDKPSEQEADMSVDKPERVYSKRTFKDQFGNYPVWMNKRKIMTQKKKNKRINRNRAISLSGGKRKSRK